MIDSEDLNELPQLRHVLQSSQFDKKFLSYIFSLTNSIRQFNQSREGQCYLNGLLSHKRAMLYFTQPSTRTFLSFQSACHILGLNTSEIRDSSISSEKKGESIEDSLRTFSSYVDLIIMRSPVPGLCNRIASLLDETDRPVPVINAGSGPDEHPTQALLDIYTLYRSFAGIGETIENKTYCLVGDLKRGRTVRSLARLLSNFKNTKLIFVSPKEFKIEEDLRQSLLHSPHISIVETENFKESISQADAIYMTRTQDEYDLEEESKKIDSSKFHLRLEHLTLLKEHCFILHPMPRREELDARIDFDRRAKYWRQERNGMWIRVALMTMILGVNERILLPKL